MSVSDKDRKILWGRSGNRCALCRRILVAERTSADDAAVIGDEAHIPAQSPGGPRYGEYAHGAVDSYENLILLCKVDHKKVDDQPQHFTAARLRQAKAEHEAWVERTLGILPEPLGTALHGAQGTQAGDNNRQTNIFNFNRPGGDPRIRDRLRFRLPRLDAHFTGRDELLARLDAALSTERAGVITQAITGLGGVGKTQVAAAYVAAHHGEFDIAAWIRAEDEGIADLAELAVALALPTAGRTLTQRATDALMFLANTDQKWLLVFDNAPGPKALRELPNSGHGRVLVTSRHRDGYEAFGAELTIDVFDTDTARQYLLARTGRTAQEASAADALAAALGHLPLALAHAGAYCTAGAGVPFSEYLEMLEALPSQELFDTSLEVFYQYSVAATWNTSITAAEQRAPLARLFLEMAAYLASESIPCAFFSVLDEDSPAGRKRAVDALTALHGYSLITLADGHVNVHRLLQAVIRDRLDGHEQAVAATYALSAIERAMPVSPETTATWPRWQELLPHVVAFASTNSAVSSAADLLALLHSTCLFLLHAGSTHAALDLSTKAVSIAMANFGADHPDTLAAQANLGASYWSAGCITEAVTIQEQVADDRERVLGPDDPATLTALNNLGASYLSAGRMDEAIAMQEQAAARFERVFGPDYHGTLTAQANLADSYQSAGRTDEAINLLERIIGDTERVLGPDHPNTLKAWLNLAFSYQSEGRTKEAISIQERATGDTERVFGPDHPNTLTAQGDLGNSYRLAGRAGESITILERVAEGRQRVLGPGHHETLVAQIDVAVAYGAAGRTSDAIALSEQVAADTERLLGAEHPITLTAQDNLGACYWSAGRISDAIPTLERVARNRQRYLGRYHHGTMTTMAYLAAAYRLAGRTSDAIALSEQVAADSERILGTDHPVTSAARHTLEAIAREADRGGSPPGS